MWLLLFHPTGNEHKTPAAAAAANQDQTTKPQQEMGLLLYVIHSVILFIYFQVCYILQQDTSGQKALYVHAALHMNFGIGSVEYSLS